MTTIDKATLDRLEAHLSYFKAHGEGIAAKVDQKTLATLLAIAREHAELVRLVKKLAGMKYCSECTNGFEYGHEPDCLIGQLAALVRLTKSVLKIFDKERICCGSSASEKHWPNCEVGQLATLVEKETPNV